MNNTSTLRSEDYTSSFAIELPTPINPFDNYHDLRAQAMLELQNTTYKRLGDKTYRLFVTNQALHEVAQQFSNQSSRRRVLQ